MTRIIAMVGAVLLATLGACSDERTLPWGRLDATWSDLESPDRDIRIATLAVLGEEAPDARAVDNLLAAARDEDPWVRRWAVETLSRGLVPADVAVPALLVATDDGMPGIREAALRSLGRLDEDAAPAVPAILAALDSARPSVALTAAWALGRIGKPAREAATPVLERVAAADRGIVSRGAARALRKMRHELARVDPAPEFGPYLSCDDLVVRIDFRGRITVGTDSLSMADLSRRFAERAREVREDDLVERYDLVLWLDGDLPWLVVRALLRIASAPEIRPHDVLFAVRTAWMGRPEALLYRLPPDDMLLDDSGTHHLGPWAVRVDVGFGGDPIVGTELARILETSFTGRTDPILAFRVADHVPVREVLPGLALGLRAGFEDIRFVDAGPADLLDVGLTERVKRLRGRSRETPGHMIFVQGEPDED